LGIRDNADANQDQIGGDMPAIGRLDPGNPAAGAENSDHSGAERDVGSPANMRFGKEPRHWHGNHPAHWLTGHFDDVDQGAAGERYGGEFEADKACPDNHDLARLLEPLPQGVRVG
jgi:hypothetical protein